MKNHLLNKKLVSKSISGFTLIELLVVISIIAMLSSIILASLNSARNKGKDSAVRAGVTQWASIMNLNYDDYGDYCNLVPSAWITASGVTCDTMYSVGTYSSKARQICKNVWENAGENNFGAPGGYKILVYTEGSTCSTAYSIVVYLNNGKWFCAGSRGIKTESTNYWNAPGCYQNP